MGGLTPVTALLRIKYLCCKLKGQDKRGNTYIQFTTLSVHYYRNMSGYPGAAYPGAGAPPGAGGYPGAGAPPGAGGYPGAGAPSGQYGGAPVVQVDPQVAKWFQAVDQDNSGQIDAAELGQALANEI